MAKQVSISSRAASAKNIDWNPVVERAKELAESYDTMVTLRQLYYRLVSDPSLGLPNKQSIYKTLSAKTAQARREGWFPALIDRTRAIESYANWSSPEKALSERAEEYRRDRTEGQEWSIYIGVEKHGMTTQLMHWFGDYGIPVLALGGYSSQTFVDDVRHDIARQDRPAVLLYAGDFDASGIDIDRDFIERVDGFDKIVRVALTRTLVKKHDLPPMPGKETDSRKAKFMLEHGEYIQVELDALPPEELRKLYDKQIDKFFDKKLWDKSKKREAKERAKAKTAAAFTGKSSEEIVGELVDGLEWTEELAGRVEDGISEWRWDTR